MEKSSKSVPPMLRREYRICGIAVLDFTLTILAAILLVSIKYDVQSREGFMKVIQLLFYLILVGSSVHKLMKVDTMLNYYLGCSDDPTIHYD